MVTNRRLKKPIKETREDCSPEAIEFMESKLNSLNPNNKEIDRKFDFVNVCELLGRLIGGGELNEKMVADELIKSGLKLGLEYKYIEKTIRQRISSGKKMPLILCSEEDKKTKNYLRTDVGNSERFSDEHGENLRYCYEQKRWIAWVFQRWTFEAEAIVEEKAEKTVVNMFLNYFRELSKLESIVVEDKEKKIKIAKDKVKHAILSQSLSRRNSMVQGSRHKLKVCNEDLDKDHFALNVANATIDLRSGKIRKHRREDFITKLSHVEIRSNSKCPLWRSFLNRVFDGNEDIISFVHKAIGYSLTGSIREQCLFLMIGPTGENGKSVFLSTLAYILGEYAIRGDFKTFTHDSRHGDSNKGPDLARIPGARVVFASEPNAGLTLDESIIRDITGGEKITANPKYIAPFEFQPQCKIWLACNTPPRMQKGGHSVERRLKVIPFNVQIPKAEIDKNLTYKLQKEASGILSWAIEGCLLWQKEGLESPESMLEALDDYAEDNDPIAEWMHSNLIKSDNDEYLMDLYDDYLLWCEKNKVRKPVSKKSLAQMFRERGWKTKRSKGGINVIGISMGARYAYNHDDYKPGHQKSINYGG
jgi:putative DNA primase/helicase